MNHLVAIDCKISPDPTRRSPLGVLDHIREAVQETRRRNPQVADLKLHDIAVKKSGRDVRLTLYFAPLKVM